MADQKTTEFAFLKMHGLGNDFVVVDARKRDVPISPALAQAIGDRHFGVGFDQLVVIHPGDTTCDARLVFLNADGSSAQACGNATRCVARFLMLETGQSTLRLTTPRGVLMAIDAGGGLVSVNMGVPLLRWDEVPLVHEMDTLNLAIEGDPVATGMGNPHCTFFVDDLDAIDLQTFGPGIEHHPLFPERTNVQIARIIGQNHIAVRVWERGVGVTLASGSSACAVTVAAARRGLTGKSVQIDLEGGSLSIDWREDGVWMTGPTQHVFSGTLTQSFLDGLT